MATIFKRGKRRYLSYYVAGVRRRTAVGESRKIGQLALDDLEIKIAQNRVGITPVDKKLKVRGYRERALFDRRGEKLRWKKCTNRQKEYPLLCPG